MRDMGNDELELRAIEEQLAAEVRAGKQPRLSAYLARYPAHAAALTDFAAALLAGEAGDVDEMDETSAKEEDGHARRAAPSTGTLQALDTLFGKGVAEPVGERPLGKVAERRARYRPQAQGLAGLAHARGVTLEALAEVVDLPLAVLAWLESDGVPGGAAPAVLLARLAAALGIGPSRVAEALAARGGRSKGADPAGLPVAAATPATVRELIATHPTITPPQRARWLALLETEDA